MALTEQQALEILRQHQDRHMNDHLFRAAVKKMRDMKADRDFLLQQRTDLYRQIDKLHKLCGGSNATP